MKKEEQTVPIKIEISEDTIKRFGGISEKATLIFLKLLLESNENIQTDSQKTA